MGLIAPYLANEISNEGLEYVDLARYQMSVKVSNNNR